MNFYYQVILYSPEILLQTIMPCIFIKQQHSLFEERNVKISSGT